MRLLPHAALQANEDHLIGHALGRMQTYAHAYGYMYLRILRLFIFSFSLPSPSLSLLYLHLSFSLLFSPTPLSLPFRPLFLSFPFPLSISPFPLTFPFPLLFPFSPSPLSLSPPPLPRPLTGIQRFVLSTCNMTTKGSAEYDITFAFVVWFKLSFHPPPSLSHTVPLLHSSTSCGRAHVHTKNPALSPGNAIGRHCKLHRRRGRLQRRFYVDFSSFFLKSMRRPNVCRSIFLFIFFFFLF